MDRIENFPTDLGNLNAGIILILKGVSCYKEEADCNRKETGWNFLIKFMFNSLTRK